MTRRSRRSTKDLSDHTLVGRSGGEPSDECVEPSVPFEKTASKVSSDSAAPPNRPSQQSCHKEFLAEGRYRRIGELGRGGWGVVDRVIDQQLGREVAVKRIVNPDKLSPLDRERFLHEAKITSQLQHPGVVPVHELGSDSGEDYYVMKLLDGDTLRKHIRRVHRERSEGSGKPKPLFESLIPLLERFVDVCQAVAYAHKNEIIHRDLKPTNVMVGAFGETIVVDWGLAREPGDPQEDETTLAGPAKPSSGLSESDGTVVGTPAYMAPEQARGEISCVGCHSDIYSLGVILYEIIAGKHPYAGMKIDRVLEEVTVGRYRPLNDTVPGTPKPLLKIVETAMSTDPSDRYPDAGQMADDVRRFLTGDKVSVYDESLIDHAARWCRRNRSLAVTVSIATSLLLVMSIAFGVIIHNAHHNEQLARIEAQQAHRQALMRLVDARDAADAWLIDLSGSLEFHPGLSPLRRQLFDQAISQYKRLIEAPLAAKESSSEPETFGLACLERAKCHLRLGDLYRLTGQSKLANDHYARATRQIRALRNDPLVIRNVSRSVADESVPRYGTRPRIGDHLRLEEINAMMGRLLVGSEKPDAFQLARARSWLAAWMPRSLDAETPGVSEFTAKAVSAAARLELVVHRFQVPQQDSSVNVLIDQGPEGQLEQASVWARWLVSNRGKPSDHSLSQTIQTDLAQSMEADHRDLKAVAAWSRLIDDLAAMIENTEPRCDHLQALGYARMRRARARSRLGHVKEAVSDYREAIKDLNQAWALTDSDAFYRSNLALAESDLAKLMMDGGVPSGGVPSGGVPSGRNPGGSEHREEAQQLLRRSIASYQSLLREEITPSLLRQMAESHLALAEILDSSESQDRGENLESADLAFQLLSDHGFLTDVDRQSWTKVKSLLDGISAKPTLEN